jgi:hypothetical protein
MVNNQVSDEITKLTYSVGRLSGAVEALTSRLNRTDDYIDKHFTDLKSELKVMIGDHNARLTHVERAHWKVSGAVGLVASIVIAGLSGWISKIWH